MTYPTQPPAGSTGFAAMPGQAFGWAQEQVSGITAPKIHESGMLCVIDRIWLTVTRIKTIIIVGTCLLTLLSMLLVAISGKKESFTAGANNVLEDVRLAVGQKLKSTFFL